MKIVFQSALIYCTLLIGVLLQSCNSISNPTMVGIENVKIEELSTSVISVNVDVILHNANNFALDLASADLQVLVDEIDVAKIFQTYDTSMPATSDFPMPLFIKMDLGKLKKDNPIAAVTRGLKIVSERELEVHLLGTIAVGKGSVKIEVPVDQIQLISF